MPTGSLKDHRYTMRVNSGLFARIRQIALSLHAPLPELFVVAVLHLFAHATSPQSYLALKAQIYAEDARRNPDPVDKKTD